MKDSDAITRVNSAGKIDLAHSLNLRDESSGLSGYNDGDNGDGGWDMGCFGNGMLGRRYNERNNHDSGNGDDGNSLRSSGIGNLWTSRDRERGAKCTLRYLCRSWNLPCTSHGYREKNSA